MNWLETLESQHSELESPLSFWKWAGIAALSATVRDNVYLDRYIYNLYCNVFIMLHADSGLKKGPPVSMAKRLVKSIEGVNIISGRSSIQGILKEMGTAKTLPGGKVIIKSTAFICSSELSSSIVEDPVATKILTDLYDRQYNSDDWKSLLKMEQFSLKDPTVTLFTATNESMGESMFDKSAVQGGFFARTFIIYESKRNKRNSLLYGLRNPPNYQKSAEYLKEIAKLKGPFAPLSSEKACDCYKHKILVDTDRTMYFSDAGKTYQDWYEKYLDLVDSMENKDETGTLNRFGDSVLKVAMLLSLARKPELIISVEAMNEAIITCEKLLGNVRKTTYGKQGISNSSALKSLIINELYSRPNHSVSRTVLMKKMWTHYTDHMEFDNMMQSFEDAKMILTSSVGNQIVYQMPEKEVAELKKFFEGRSRK